MKSFEHRDIKPNHQEKKSLPSVRVKNEVVFVNSNIAYPFQIKEGEETNLGLFITNPSENIESDLDLGIDPMHHRSGHVGKVIFKDNYNNIYHDVDLKGMGLIGDSVDDPTLRAFEPSIRPADENSAWGVWDIKKAFREKDITEDLATSGVRTNRIIGITKLLEIALPNGEKISIEKAKERKMIPEEFEPVIGIRAYRMRERIQHKNEKSLEVFEEAKSIIEKELGKQLSWEEYAGLFARTLGKNLAKTHNVGYWHGFLSAHNVTMACEIVDFGFGEGSKKIDDLPPEQLNHTLNVDFHDAKATALTPLLNKMKELNLISDEHQSYFKSFETAYLNEIRNKYKDLIKPG